MVLHNTYDISEYYLKITRIKMANAITGVEPVNVSSYGVGSANVSSYIEENSGPNLSVWKMVGKIHFHVVYCTEVYYFVQFVGDGLESGKFISARMLKITNLETIVQYHEKRILNEEDRNSLNQTMFMAQKNVGDILM